jgi:hypothetical protein
MGLVDRILGEKRTEKTKSPAKLLNFFAEGEGSENFPLTLALTSLESIGSGAKNEEDYLLCLLEDSVFSSLYVTFYEKIFSAIKENPSKKNALIEAFAADINEREKVIGIQSQNHINFVENNAFCKGCASCDNHPDVSELVSFWINKDVTFFESLYVGMQTIQFSMEQLLYEAVPRNEELLDELSPETILKFRQALFDFSAKAI